jgi:hypothetical protein
MGEGSHSKPVPRGGTVRAVESFGFHENSLRTGLAEPAEEHHDHGSEVPF